MLLCSCLTTVVRKVQSYFKVWLLYKLNSQLKGSYVCIWMFNNIRVGYGSGLMIHAYDHVVLVLPASWKLTPMWYSYCSWCYHWKIVTVLPALQLFWKYVALGNHMHNPSESSITFLTEEAPAFKKWGVQNWTSPLTPPLQKTFARTRFQTISDNLILDHLT